MSKTSNNFWRRYKLNWLTILILSGIFVFSLESCKERPLSHEYISIANGVWDVRDTCNFHINIQKADTEYDIYFYLRHTASYPFSNLWLFVDRIAPDNSVFSDTIACKVADYTGKWKASGVGSIMTLTIPYQERYQFSQSGDYQYRIRHGMRTETLEGVQAIGLKVDYHGKK